MSDDEDDDWDLDSIGEYHIGPSISWNDFFESLRERTSIQVAEFQLG